MKSTILFKLTGVLFFTLLITYLPAQVKIGDNPSIQDPSAVLELEKTNMGLLITRVSLIRYLGCDNNSNRLQTACWFIIQIMVDEGPDAVSPGFYYFREDEGRWIRLMTGSGGTGGDVWIDANNNILSVNSEDQTLDGFTNVAIGKKAFGDLNGASNYVVAIGDSACREENTTGDAYVVAIGHRTAYANSGINLNAMGPYAAHDNSGMDVNAFGADAAFNNDQISVNALGNAAAINNHGWEVNALGPESCSQNTGNVVNAMGILSAANNVGWDVNAFGAEAAVENYGDRLNAFGTYSAVHNTGQDVNALGWEAANNNHGVDGGGNHVNALGNQAAFDNSGGLVNALGLGAARNNQGSLVNALGGAAGENNLGWSVNVLGNQSGQFNEGAELNAMGAMSAQYNTTSAVNAFGRMAARYNTGYGTNALGDEAAKFNNGEHNVAIGNQAMLGDTNVLEGGGNIGIGYQAAMNVGTGQRNICIGHETDIPNPSADDQINIGNNIIRDADGVIQLKDVIQLPPTIAPASPVAGMIYFDGAMLYCYDGYTWQALW